MNQPAVHQREHQPTSTLSTSAPPPQHIGPLANSHVHLPPNFSAFDSPEQAVDIAAREGVRVLGTSNYYDYRVYQRFAAAAAKAGVMPLFGNEIHTVAHDLSQTRVNDPLNPGQFNICGKALSQVNEPTETAQLLMQGIRSKNDERARTMIQLAGDTFAAAGLQRIPSYDYIIETVAKRCAMPVAWVSLQERHIAEAFQEMIFETVAPEQRTQFLERLWQVTASLDITDPDQVQEAIRFNLLKANMSAFVPVADLPFKDGYALILALGGIPCYPVFADAASTISEFESPAPKLVERILDRALYCAELFPSRNKPELVDEYVYTLRRAGIVVVAGTDHNTRRMAPLIPTTVDGTPLSQEVQDIFWEGACVLVAHQQLAKTGTGFVDSYGQLAGDFDSPDARIQWFAEAGRNIIASQTREFDTI